MCVHTRGGKHILVFIHTRIHTCVSYQAVGTLTDNFFEMMGHGDDDSAEDLRP